MVIFLLIVCLNSWVYVKNDEKLRNPHQSICFKNGQGSVCRISHSYEIDHYSYVHRGRGNLENHTSKKSYYFKCFLTFSVVCNSNVSPYTKFTGCHGPQTCYLKHINSSPRNILMFMPILRLTTTRHFPPLLFSFLPLYYIQKCCDQYFKACMLDVSIYFSPWFLTFYSSLLLRTYIWGQWSF